MKSYGGLRVYIYSFTLSAPLQVNAPLAAREAKAVVDDIRNHSMTDADAFKRSNEGMKALWYECTNTQIHEYTSENTNTRIYGERALTSISLIRLTFSVRRDPHVH